MRLQNSSHLHTIFHSFAMKASILSFFLILFALHCGGNSTTGASNTATTAALLQESGSEGCTVSGINNQIRAGYTLIETTSKGVNFRLVQDTYYSVMQIKGAMIGTTIQFNKEIKPTVYQSSSCPLNLDTDVLTKNGSEYTLTQSLNRTQISFNKASSYLLYFYMKEVPLDFGLTVSSAGTPVQIAGDSLSGLFGTGSTSASGTSSSANTFQFACNNATVGACANYFLSSTGTTAITTCSLGPTSATKQTARCTETDIVATCKQSLVGVGTIITLYTSPLTSSTASSLCPSSTGGTFATGSTIPSP